MVKNFKEDVERIRALEEAQRAIGKDDPYYPAFHLAPPVGWLNDPNGLCQMGDVHHIFFQYSPQWKKGGQYWGHYETKDFINYDCTGAFLAPDSNEDRSGVYSGSALLEDGVMYLYYTGNVKEEGDYDYIYEGRGANVILVESKDGRVASKKQVLLTNGDYPKNLSCHVRDPKVWKGKDGYFMVLGARTKDDKGCILLYRSDDKYHWEFMKFIETKERFGYMWECPDYFLLGGHSITATCPQGLKSEEYRFQNIHQSGYFTDLRVENFLEWDMGFDFYAPQTYEDQKGRRIMIGWMGVPDAPFQEEPSMEKGWSQLLTVPRQLIYDSTQRLIRQWPIEELEQLRDGKIDLEKEALPSAYELLLDKNHEDDLELLFDDALLFTYHSGDKTCQLRFLKDGYGREVRNISLNHGIRTMRVLVDRCSIEIFINAGSYVMTSKFFYHQRENRERTLKVDGKFSEITCLRLKEFNIKLA
ncbi:MAG: glycoside hydrolase family 32 protein [Lachnospiraceae bacterium]|nr:glycoside hydrolase family 32 protein [Lachnospiraceae bacterium]